MTPDQRQPRATERAHGGPSASDPRYAVYYAPAVGSPWWGFGAGWLGWDEQRGVALPQPRLPEFPVDDFHALTAEPRRYGFHATLKAPFRLRAHVTEGLLGQRVTDLARHLRAVQLGPLQPRRLDGFVALVPTQEVPAVTSLAMVCVLEIDDLRAPLTQADLQRRRPEGLDATGRELLARYGYPHVLQRFRFHMTLTGAVDTATGDIIVRRAGEALEALTAAGPPTLDRICLFRQDHPGAPFLRIQEEVLQP